MYNRVSGRWALQLDERGGRGRIQSADWLRDTAAVIHRARFWDIAAGRHGREGGEYGEEGEYREGGEYGEGNVPSSRTGFK
jgi:hypothetical protein